MPGQATPYIVVDFEINTELVFIVIRNTDERNAAYNLRIKPSAAIKGLGGKKNIALLNVFKEIRYLAPKKEIRVFVDTYDSFFAHQEKTAIKFTISYEDDDKKVFRKSIEHNLDIYKDLISYIQKT